MRFERMNGRSRCKLSEVYRVFTGLELGPLQKVGVEVW